MSTDVLLVSPSFLSVDDSKKGLKAESTSPPLGFLYIAAMLKSHGYSVGILDLFPESITKKSQFVRKLRKFKPRLVGISTLTGDFQNVLEITEICKKEFPNSPVMLGGYFATFNHDRLLKKYCDIDLIVRGEGEETTTELAGELDKRKSNLSRIKGLSYRENNRIKVNSERPMIKNLDSLPFPAYELVSHLNYNSFGDARIASGNLMGTLTSRGCVYRCTYCACSALANYTIRWRSPENVVSELKYFHDKFGLKEFLFVDDNFTFDKNRVIDICKLIKEQGLDINWYAEGRVNHSDQKMFHDMNRTGCKIIYFGIESCVDRILKYYRKGITYEMAKDAIKKAQRAKFEIAGSFILGAPIETVDEMWETVNKAMKLDIDFAQFNQLIIARGIPLWDQLVQQGLIDDEKQWEEVIKGFELNPEISEEEFKELMVKFHRGFYFRKSYITKQIARTLMHRKRKVLLNLNQLGKLNREMKSILHIK